MIRPLTSADAQAFVDLRKQSFSTDPLSWDYEPGTTVDVETWAPRLVETDNEVVFGYFSEGESGVLQLTGVIGLQRFSKLKRSHRAMVWGVYVSPAVRGRGAASQLLDAVISRAKSMVGIDHLILSLSNHATAARRLYTSAGFVEWGRELRAARTGDIWMDEIHMRLDLQH